MLKLKLEANPDRQTQTIFGQALQGSANLKKLGPAKADLPRRQ
jgi:hypothetical protein